MIYEFAMHQCSVFFFNKRKVLHISVAPLFLVIIYFTYNGIIKIQ